MRPIRAGSAAAAGPRGHRTARLTAYCAGVMLGYDSRFALFSEADRGLGALHHQKKAASYSLTALERSIDGNSRNYTRYDPSSTVIVTVTSTN